MFFLFKLLQFLLKHLIKRSGFFPPRLALGFAFSRVSRNFTTIDIGKALRLALKFGAQFVFRHVRILFLV